MVDKLFICRGGRKEGGREGGRAGVNTIASKGWFPSSRGYQCRTRTPGETQWGLGGLRLVHNSPQAT